MPAGHRFATRDCLYHVYPLGGTQSRVWRQRLATLLRRAPLFNGLRVISCMTGPQLEHAREVRALAGPAGFEVVEIANDPKLREVVTLRQLLPRFETADPARALFFGHAKGVTKPDNEGVTCHPWAAVCHEVCLDYWPLVEAALAAKPIAGPFKKLGAFFHPQSRSAWHFSGSFFWARSADLFARAWRDVDHFRFGAESTPGVWYDADEAACLFHQCKGPTNDLYKMSAFGQVACEYALWRAEREAYRTPQEMTR